MSLIAIIIPCFNEEKRLKPAGVLSFLKLHSYYHFIFVDDGSSDRTGNILDDLEAKNNLQVTQLKLTTNKGKANAVREGFLLCATKKAYSFIGYLDADLSTDYEEMIRLTNLVKEQNLDFAFGSRMKKLNATINRSGFRHLAGRVITTIIDTYFKLGIYDTQCGAKLFTMALAETVMKEPFVTNWLFDVEIFLRIRQFCPTCKGEELSLQNWTSRNGSKINILSTPELMIELINLIRFYPTKPHLHG
jgi:glycosyltransferase involved in cell wall biosynthesis